LVWATAGLRTASAIELVDPKTPRGRYEALVLESQKASQAFREELHKAKTDAERTRILSEKAWRDRAYLARFLEIAESAPDDPAAVDALIWIVTFGFHGRQFDRAIDILVERHVARRKVGEAAANLSGSASPSAEKLLRAVVANGTDDTIKGTALWLSASTSSTRSSAPVASWTDRTRPRAGKPCFLRTAASSKPSLNSSSP
jgi:hypothetical protein